MTDRIRAAVPSDLEPIKEIAVATELFSADDVSMFDELFGGSLNGSLDGHAWLVLEGEAGAVGGAAYYAPEPFSDRLWNLYFLGVSPDLQGTGGGTDLVDAVEDELAAMGSERARILLVETSGLPTFEPTRRFYRGLGFDEEARIRDFYGPGDDKVVYWKSILADDQATCH
ncbi:MAG: GNAT family N-acetyltransferase [Acidimicrobiales bacterium]